MTSRERNVLVPIQVQPSEKLFELTGNVFIDGMCYDGHHLYFGYRHNGNGLLRYDLEGELIAQIAIPEDLVTHLNGITFDSKFSEGRGALVTFTWPENDAISRIDRHTGALLHRWPKPKLGEDEHLQSVLWDGEQLWQIILKTKPHFDEPNFTEYPRFQAVDEKGEVPISFDPIPEFKGVIQDGFIRGNNLYLMCSNPNAIRCYRLTEGCPLRTVWALAEQEPDWPESEGITIVNHEIWYCSYDNSGTMVVFNTHISPE